MHTLSTTDNTYIQILRQKHNVFVPQFDELSNFQSSVIVQRLMSHDPALARCDLI